MATVALLPLLGGILLPNAGGLLSSLAINMRTLNEWYTNLELPKWKPPNWLFGPAWLILYTLIGVSSYLVWKKGNGFHDSNTAFILVFYVIHLILNWLWVIFFFGFRDPELGLYGIWLVDITALATAILFFTIDKTAGLLFIPYLAWLGYATALNTYIVSNEKKS